MYALKSTLATGIARAYYLADDGWTTDLAYAKKYAFASDALQDALRRDVDAWQHYVRIVAVRQEAWFEGEKV